MDAAFATHKLNDQGMARATRIAEAFNDLFTKLGDYCAPGRELAIVRTKLEEAAFFAKKAMAIDPANQGE